MANVTITREQYEALISASGPSQEVDRLRDIIDKQNSIKRYFLYIRWQDVGGLPPPRVELGKGWPKNNTYLLQKTSPITRQDVDTILAQSAKNPTAVMVTPDRAGNVGWTLIDDYNFTIGT